MDYQMLVRNLFNDMFVFLNGTQPLGLEPLRDVYQDEPLLAAFIGRLDEAMKVPYNEVMKACYAFYKKHAGSEFTDADWEAIVAEVGELLKKWENPWCKGVILALLEMLEREEKERKAVQAQEDTAAGLPADETAEDQEPQQEMELAA